MLSGLDHYLLLMELSLAVLLFYCSGTEGVFFLETGGVTANLHAQSQQLPTVAAAPSRHNFYWHQRSSRIAFRPIARYT